MVDPIPTDVQRQLASRLKGEAEATRPAFSEALHARIREALERERPAPSRRSVASRLRGRWLSVAIAATLLAGAALVALWPRRSPLPGPTTADPRVALVEKENATETSDRVADPDTITVPTGQVAGHLGLLVDDAFTEGQWAYLDHDVGVAIRLLFDQLPLDADSIEQL